MLDEIRWNWACILALIVIQFIYFYSVFLTMHIVALQEYKWIAYVKMWKIVNTQTKKNMQVDLRKLASLTIWSICIWGPKFKVVPSLYHYTSIRLFHTFRAAQHPMRMNDVQTMSLSLVYIHLCVCVCAHLFLLRNMKNSWSSKQKKTLSVVAFKSGVWRSFHEAANYTLAFKNKTT